MAGQFIRLAVAGPLPLSRFRIESFTVVCRSCVPLHPLPPRRWLSSDIKYNQAAAKGDEPSAVIWGRVNEQSRRLALIYAVSENHLNPLISKSAADWASQLVMHQTKRMLFMAQTYVADNPFHALCLKVIQKLQEAPNKRLDHNTLLKRMKVSTKALAEIIETLICQGDISCVAVSRAGKPRVEYRLT